MKVLSIRQPWAWFIVNGYKDIENRGWSTCFRGPVLIHAGKKFDEEGWHEIKEIFDTLPEETMDRLQRAGSITPRKIMETLGGIVGYAEIVDCVEKSDSPWFFGEYGFVLKNAKPLPFIPCRGQLGFFNLSKEAIKPMDIDTEGRQCPHCKTYEPLGIFDNCCTWCFTGQQEKRQ